MPPSRVHPFSRRVLLACGLYLVVTAAMLLLAPSELFRGHTRYNHFALLAEAWWRGDIALAGEPPAYAGLNDFAQHRSRWFVVFPPFPAVVVLPFVAVAGSAERVPDGLVFLWVSGLGPALTFLALERARAEWAMGTERASLGLALLLAFGTPYFFSAVQGTVWFAAHVVGVALMALYCYAAIGARRPFLAGAALGLAFLTRAPMLLAAPLFLLEAWRTAGCRPLDRCSGHGDPAPSTVRVRFLRSSTLFALPLLLAMAAGAVHNLLRFGDPLEPGYQYLAVRWQARIQAWGLFHYHYLPRNLGVLLTSLPWTGDGQVPFRINGHGLALWFTSPILIWVAVRSRSPRWTRTLLVSAAAVALPTLFYQNTGWVQFAYRFANDYVVLLVLALGSVHLRLSRPFIVAAIWSVGVNLFGALSFGRVGWEQYYFVEPTQSVLYEPD